MSTVSVLICTNRLKFLPWWMHQIVKQTRQPDEVVVGLHNIRILLLKEPFNLNDGTHAFRRFRAHHLSADLSLGEARQFLLEQATSDIILWMDDDDWYHPRRIELSVAAIESGAYDATVFPLTHLYFTDDKTLHDYPSGAGFALPAMAARTELARKTRFSPVSAMEERSWLHPLLHGDKETPSIIPPKRLYYMPDYIEPNIGGIVLVHGQNTWTYSKQHLYNIAAGRPLSSIPPKDVTREEWETTKKLLENL